MTLVIDHWWIRNVMWRFLPIFQCQMKVDFFIQFLDLEFRFIASVVVWNFLAPPQKSCPHGIFWLGTALVECLKVSVSQRVFSSWHGSCGCPVQIPILKTFLLIDSVAYMRLRWDSNSLRKIIFIHLIQSAYTQMSPVSMWTQTVWQFSGVNFFRSASVVNGAATKCWRSHMTEKILQHMECRTTKLQELPMNSNKTNNNCKMQQTAAADVTLASKSSVDALAWVTWMII